MVNLKNDNQLVTNRDPNKVPNLADSTFSASYLKSASGLSLGDLVDIAKALEKNPSLDRDTLVIGKKLANEIDHNNETNFNADFPLNPTLNALKKFSKSDLSTQEVINALNTDFVIQAIDSSLGPCLITCDGPIPGQLDNGISYSGTSGFIEILIENGLSQESATKLVNSKWHTVGLGARINMAKSEEASEPLECAVFELLNFAENYGLKLEKLGLSSGDIKELINYKGVIDELKSTLEYVMRDNARGDGTSLRTNDNVSSS